MRACATRRRRARWNWSRRLAFLKRGLTPFFVAALCVTAAGAGVLAYRQWMAPAPLTEVRPDLEFRDLDGNPHRLSEWSGKLLLLNFWATWCTPCLKEIPLLVEAQKQHAARGLQIVGVAMDPVRAFRERLGINYPLMVGEAEVIDAMDRLGDPLGAFPFSVLIAPDGRIIDRASGDLSREELEAWLEAHLPR
jgi:thiol-disulfide isomerase/thioredoxin